MDPFAKINGQEIFVIPTFTTINSAKLFQALQVAKVNFVWCIFQYLTNNETKDCISGWSKEKYWTLNWYETHW